MEKLLEKARSLTILERKKLGEEGIYILNVDPKRQDEAIIKILSLVYSDEELAEVTTPKQEDDLVNKIITLTYSIGEEDSKN